VVNKSIVILCACDNLMTSRISMNMKTNHDDYQLYFLFISTFNSSQPLYIYFKMHDIKINSNWLFMCYQMHFNFICEHEL